MQYSNLIGESLDNARKYLNNSNINVLFIETKDRFNEFTDKRIIRIMQTEDKLELLYTGFPPYKE